MRFPKKLHFCWIGDLGDIPEEDASAPFDWLRLNPDHSIHVWDETKVLDLISTEFPKHLNRWNEINLDIKKADFARLLILLSQGGGYLDYDLKPKQPIESIWKSGVVYNRCWEGLQKLPDIPAEDKTDFEKYDSVLVKESCLIDGAGHGIANGVMFVQQGEEWIERFIDQQKEAHRGYVLDFMGPPALTRFVRSNIDLFKDRTCLLPPHYFIFEKEGVEEVPDYCVSVHPAKNSWGDSTKKRWWRVA